MWDMESESAGQIQPLTVAEENMIFQSNYKETTQIKTSKLHGHGYMAKYQMRRELMKDNLEVHARVEAAVREKRIAVDVEFQKMKEQLEKEAAEREREKEEYRRKMQEDLESAKIAIREELKQEFLSMLAQQQEKTALQATPQINDSAQLTPAMQDDDRIDEHHPASVVTAQHDVASKNPSGKNTSTINRNLFDEEAANGPPKFMAKTRGQKRKNQVDKD